MNQFGAALVSPSKKRRSDVAATSGDPSVLRHEADREVPFKGMVLKKHSFKVPLDYDGGW